MRSMSRTPLAAPAGGLCLCALMAAVTAASMPAALAAPKGAVHAIVIDGMQYTPSTLEVRAGDTVIWKNRDPFPHTATSEGAPGGAPEGKAFDSGDIQPGKSWKMVAEKRGEFSYVCTLHRTMKAKLVVK